MKFLTYIIAMMLFATLHSFSQNSPNAVNDTLYIAFNDSTYIQSANGNPYFLVNDSDPDGDFIHIDSAYYTGTGNFSDTILIISPTFFVWRFSYQPPINYVGLDSIHYILADDEIPEKYDTATIYLYVKHQEFEFLDLNNIKARVSLYGLFNDVVNSISSFEVPKGTQKNTFFAANLWLAGKVQDSVYASCETFGTYYYTNNNYSNFISRSSPIMDSAYYKIEYDYDWDRLWKINIQDIIYHQNNWNNAGYQASEVIENWPAHGDTAKGQAFYLAPFIDYNSDGIYNPYDGDYPKIKGQLAIYHIYNDERIFAGSGSSMKAEIHCMAYAYNCQTDSALNNTIFVDYTIHNRSNLTYDSTYIGMWTDFDIGNSNDDYIGCDVQRSTFYGYNGDNIDEDGNGVFGYQNRPPVQGVTFLKGVPQDNDGVDNPLTTNVAQAYAQNGIVYPELGLGFGDGVFDNENWGMEHFVYYSIGGGQFNGDGDPQNSLEYYNYLKGFWRDNTSMVWGGNGNAASSGGTLPAKYMFPDNTDPLFYGTYGVSPTPTTWSELTAGNPPGDRRGMGSTGPFTFEPDSSVEITLAFVFGRDYQNIGNTAGLVVMQERVDSLHSYYRNGFTTTACGAALSVQENEMSENALEVYPNPFNHLLTINYELENRSARLSIYNMIGEQIKTQEITEATTTIDLSNQSKGIYFVTITDGKKRVTRKVIKQ